MTKVVISETFGGFCLSPEAERRVRELGWEGKYARHIERDDPRLVQVVEELGRGANTWASNLVVVEVPDDAEWYVHEYDGFETVYERHRAWDSEGERVMGADA